MANILSMYRQHSFYINIDIRIWLFWIIVESNSLVKLSYVILLCQKQLLMFTIICLYMYYYVNWALKINFQTSLNVHVFEKYVLRSFFGKWLMCLRVMTVSPYIPNIIYDYNYVNQENFYIAHSF